MTQQLNIDNITAIHPNSVRRKSSTKNAVSLLYRIKHSPLTYSERIKDLNVYCDIRNLNLVEIYDFTTNDIGNVLRHQLKFSKILNNIQEEKHGAHPVVLLFETLDDIEYMDNLWELTYRIEQMVGEGIIEIHIAKEKLVFCQSVKQNYDLLFKPELWIR